MDMESWTTLERLAREAKATLEATEPRAEAEIDACETVAALAEGVVTEGTWTSDPDVLDAWLDRAQQVAVAVCNGHELEDSMYLPLDGVDGAQKILTGWLAQGPDEVRREAQVKYGDDGAHTATAFVTLCERSVRIAGTAEAHGGS